MEQESPLLFFSMLDGLIVAGPKTKEYASVFKEHGGCWVPALKCWAIPPGQTHKLKERIVELETKEIPAAPSAPTSPIEKSPEESIDLKAASELWFREVNSRVFDNKIPSSVKVVWVNKSGVIRAGAYLPAKGVIKLYSHVLRDIDQMKHTLAHEMCHAAVHHIDPTPGMKSPHGPEFKQWMARCNRILALKHPITVRHKFAVEGRVMHKCDACGFRRVYMKPPSVCRSCKKGTMQPL